mgnify:CR=1 FL=1
MIIAEIGSVHDGSLGNAKKLVNIAKSSGASFVKFQMHFAEEETLKNALSPKYFSEETSEYSKVNISQFPEHQKTMNDWISHMSQFHKQFEVMVKSKKKHRLDLDTYINTNISIKSDNFISDQLKKLKDLYKSGVLTKNEFEKAKKKILN